MLLVKYGIRIVRGERKAQIPLLIKYSKKKKVSSAPQEASKRGHARMEFC